MRGRCSLALGLIYTLLHTRVARGQTTNTTCEKNPNNSFLFNSLNESPCMAWAKLQALCVPQTAYINIPPLVDHTYGYDSPGRDGTACQCNLVAYNLMAGCSWCQIGSGGTWSSQWAYSQGCPDFRVQNLGFSQDSVEIPSYAWRNWDTDRFDPALAAAAAPSFATISLPPESTTLSRNFQTTSIPLSTPQSSPASSSSTSNTASQPGSGNGASSGSESKDSGPPKGIMIAAIAGSIGAVILVASIILFLILRKRRRARARAAHVKAVNGAMEEREKMNRRFDPNYHSSTDWKSKHRSFLEILTPKGDGGGDDGNSAHGIATRKKRRVTKPFSQLFTSPRTAPLPFGQVRQAQDGSDKTSLDSLRYTTTSQRLGHKTGQESFSSGSEVSFGINPPQVNTYTKAKNAPAFPQPAVTESVFSQMTAGSATGMRTGTMYGAPPPQSALLKAVNQMRKDEDEDDPLESPPAKDFDKHSSYPFPPTPPDSRIASPPIIPGEVSSSVGGGGGGGVAGKTEKALPATPGRIKGRISTKIPDPRFSSTTSGMGTGTAITLPQPPITPAHDFTLAPEEYRRKQSKRYSGHTVHDIDTNPNMGGGGVSKATRKSVLPSFYEPESAATRFSLGQRADAGLSRPVTQFGTTSEMEVPKTTTITHGHVPGNGYVNTSLDDAESMLFSATPSISASTDSRYSSFIPDAQTVARVKAALVSSLNSPSPKETGSPPLRFPLPPSRSGSGSQGTEQEWERAKSKQKLSQEVKKIGRKGPVQERGDENGLRRKGM